MKGPRTFALTLLLALLVLPRTGWIVRNHVDVLAGRWGSFAQTMGFTGVRDLSPLWAFQSDAITDPVAASFVEPLSSGLSNEAREARYRSALNSSEARSRALAPLLRQAFRSLFLPEAGQKLDPRRSARVESFARLALPLAIEGEQREPNNSFFPSSRWVVEILLGRPAEADAALSRAAKGTYYDDGSFQEADLVVDAFERRYGYRGNGFRLAEEACVLLPQYASLSRAVRALASDTRLTDVRRGQAMRLGEILVETSRTGIGILVGQNIIGQAAGSGKNELKIEGLRSNVAAFGRANPQVDISRWMRLLKRQPDWPVTEGYDEVVSSPAPQAGAALLLATIGCAVLGFNRRHPVDEALLARARRANWAYLAAIPASFLDGGDHTSEQVIGVLTIGMVAALLARKRWGWKPSLFLGGGLSLLGCGAAFGDGRFLPAWIVPGFIFVSALLMPEKGRWVTWAVAMTLVAAGMALWPQRDLAMVPILMLLTGVAARGALPARKGMEWSASLCAALYLLAIAWNLRLDAQQGEVRASFRTEAERFRGANGL